MRIKTNSLEPGEAKETEGSTLFEIYKAFATPAEADAMRAHYAAGAAWGQLKQDLCDYLAEHLRTARADYERLMAAPDHVESLLRRGAERARALATPFLGEIRRAVGIRSLG
jgi:tryptophanyl-tRNA synthetase